MKFISIEHNNYDDFKNHYKQKHNLIRIHMPTCMYLYDDGGRVEKITK